MNLMRDKWIPVKRRDGTIEDIAPFEVTNIERLGFWLLVDDKEYFITFADYPVFKRATVEQLHEIKRIAPSQFHWPTLDADIELEALDNPSQFTLEYNTPQRLNKKKP
ncbi:MAG: hypothetical protein LDLANPLL_02832 [Turneriella sp.]|nr:hypothetical protein [Turneriella sp.]